MIKLVTTEIGIREIDTVKQKESLGTSCFQGFLAIYRYKEKVVRVDDFYQIPLFCKTLNYMLLKTDYVEY